MSHYNTLTEFASRKETRLLVESVKLDVEIIMSVSEEALSKGKRKAGTSEAGGDKEDSEIGRDSK